MITEVRIAGALVDPCYVVAAATVLHGRGAVDDGPAPSSATLVVLATVAAGMPKWAVGDTLSLTSVWGPLFTGIISDRRISGHFTDPHLGPCARIEVTGAGPVAMLGRRIIGDEPWPQEAASVRAGRVLTLAALPHLVEAPVTPEVRVHARDVDAQTALALLTDLAADTAAAVVDLPDGRVVYQPLESRHRPQFYLRWMDFPPAQTWADFNAATTWADLGVLSPASEVPVPLPSCAVGYEPEWISTAGAIVNSVRIGYGIPAEGSEQATLSAEDAASVARYGRRSVSEGTQLATLADASSMASRILSTRAWETWALGSVDVYADLMTEAEKAAVAGLRCGDWVQVADLPQPAPAIAWAGICEGWTYTESVAAGERQAVWTLALSDPVASLAVPMWADHTPTHEWRLYAPLNTWADLTSLTAIGA